MHLNCALRVDGRMGTDAGTSLPISCRDDWRRVHVLRETCDGVAVGAKTWIGDSPRLTVRREVLGRDPLRQPARVIFAGGWECEVQRARRRTFVIGRGSGDREHAVHIHSADRRLAEVLGKLHDHGIGTLLVEGGPTLLRSFLDQGIFDRLTFYVATTRKPAARRALEKVFPELPELSCVPFGEGMLLAHSCAYPQEVPIDPHPWLDGRIRYLDLGAADGERLALLGPVPLPMRIDGEARGFDWYVYGTASLPGSAPDPGRVSSVLVYGDLRQADAPLVRLHSGCQTGDVFASLRCDCGAQLHKALEEIVGEGAGLAIYLTDHEGRGIGLWAKAMAYLLQDGGLDTYQANRDLGLPEDARSYDEAAAVLDSLLGHRRLRLLSN
ncbi:MAG: dihydrofolate reductase family protein, partial [Holophagales bacterium]|nr:dihydrofolate reductase family protein [Holophagales bacterium]